MGLWRSLRFGARAISLRRAARRSREVIERVQRARLEKLVRHVRAKSAFYGQTLADVREGNFQLSDLPTTNKSEIMENFDDVVTVDDLRREEVAAFLEDESNLGKFFRGKYVLSNTSGSQGQPLLLVQTIDNLELLFALNASRGNRRPLGLAQVLERFASPARLAAVTLKRGFYPSGVAFEYLPPGARPYIKTLQLSLADEDFVARLAEFRPTHLTAYASVLHELARQVEQGKLTLQPELEQVVNISERLMPRAREHYARVFGAPILDDYAMGECLFLTNGCTTSSGMHVNADWVIMEVVDETNRPVPAGKKGAKILITNLANYVQPLIRYEIGDIVTMAAEPCGCGSNLPLVARVEGRDSDMFWIETAEGERPLQPAVFDMAFSQVIDAREFQVIQEENNRLRVRFEPLPGVSFDRGRAERAIHEQLTEYGMDGKLQVEVEVVDRLAPEGGQKFKRIVTKRDAAKKAKTKESVNPK